MRLTMDATVKSACSAQHVIGQDYVLEDRGGLGRRQGWAMDRSANVLVACWINGSNIFADFSPTKNLEGGGRGNAEYIPR